MIISLFVLSLFTVEVNLQKRAFAAFAINIHDRETLFETPFCNGIGRSISSLEYEMKYLCLRSSRSSSQCLHIFWQLILRSHASILGIIRVTIALALTLRGPLLRSLALTKHHLTWPHVIRGLRGHRLWMSGALLHSGARHAQRASHGASRPRWPNIRRWASHLR